MRSRLAFGVGLNDAGYIVQRHEIIGYKENGKNIRKQVWVCPYYQAWYSMIRRCYSEGNMKLNRTYEGCIVSEEWHLFSNFKKWMELQDWKGKQLDKDLFGDGKLYSKDTCCFINNQINCFIQDGSKGTSNCRGVSWKTKNKKWVAQIQNPLQKAKLHIGLYESEEEAKQAYNVKKNYFSKILAENITDCKIKSRFLDKYKI